MLREPDRREPSCLPLSPPARPVISQQRVEQKAKSFDPEPGARPDYSPDLSRTFHLGLGARGALKLLGASPSTPEQATDAEALIGRRMRL